MYRKKISSTAIILGLLLVASNLFFLAFPYYTFANPVEDSDCAIAVSPPSGLFQLDNMNPGDENSATLTIINEGESPFTVHLGMKWTGGDPLPGEIGDLYNQITMVISYQELVFYDGLMSDLEGDKNDRDSLLDLGYLVGPIFPGEPIDLDFTVFLPGAETGNEFQGSMLQTTIFLLTSCGTVTEIPPEPPGTEPPGGTNPPGTEPPGTNPPELPKTGVFIHIVFTFIGFFLIIAGLMLKHTWNK